MNARYYHLDDSDDAAGAPVLLRLKSFGGARAPDVDGAFLGPKRGQTGAEEFERLPLLPPADNPVSRHAQPIRWGINE